VVEEGQGWCKTVEAWEGLVWGARERGRLIEQRRMITNKSGSRKQSTTKSFWLRRGASKKKNRIEERLGPDKWALEESRLKNVARQSI